MLIKHSFYVSSENRFINEKISYTFFPVWYLENITVPIVIRIGEFTNLNLGEKNNVQFQYFACKKQEFLKPAAPSNLSILSLL